MLRGKRRNLSENSWLDVALNPCYFFFLVLIILWRLWTRISLLSEIHVGIFGAPGPQMLGKKPDRCGWRSERAPGWRLELWLPVYGASQNIHHLPGMLELFQRRTAKSERCEKGQGGQNNVLKFWLDGHPQTGSAFSLLKNER
jgi:hypothetical protein